MLSTQFLDTDNKRLVQFAMLFDKAFVDREGNSWYNAKHVGTVLGMANRSIYNATTRDWFKPNDLLYLGSRKGGLYLSQAAVYNLLMRSQAKLASMFREPKTNEEIKEIRKCLREQMHSRAKAANKDMRIRTQASLFDNFPNHMLDFLTICLKEGK